MALYHLYNSNQTMTPITLNGHTVNLQADGFINVEMTTPPNGLPSGILVSTPTGTLQLGPAVPYSGEELAEVIGRPDDPAWTGGPATVIGLLKALVAK